MSGVEYKVRLMQKEDIPQALDIWRETGNQEGTDRLYTWLEVDPEGFYVAVTDAGEILGVCSAVIHHEDLVFVGLYSVRKKYRKQGIGSKIWSACMDHIGSRNAALNSVPDRWKMYRDSSGFPLLENEWLSAEYLQTEGIQMNQLSESVPPGIEIEPYTKSHLPLMLDYDRNLIGYGRELAVKLTCEEKDSYTFVALKDGACVGYGVIKMSCQGAGHVGPLYADDPSIAEAMLTELVHAFRAQWPEARGFGATTISINAKAREMYERLGCPLVEECHRLYRKQALKVDTNKVFAHFDMNFSPF
ncbi:uncharacterized protein LOC129216146 [Uloborus diversus]|uniref:uncharacterized protein LOC129216146 n=1 Tax=Uloborus diversus TaxID=327109 RepID=UPI002409328C|nr:uncharacterized protein LOC129216146 [Uloborus diversus]XP_054706278.1 uncharacterized protein LOC129216146 [Uloborus diversus]